MSVSQFRVTCDSYKNNICDGFSLLQQKQEFVDMTLAAEGHFVKVHQSIVALCSPYIKEILKTVPGQHPVIILNNVTYEILCFILEYIYTGEVHVPSEKLDIFLKAANNLHLSGVDKLGPVKDFTVCEDTICTPSIETIDNTRYVIEAPNITINTSNFNSELHIDDIQDLNFTSFQENDTETIKTTCENLTFEPSTISTETNAQDSSILQYTVSNRGSLQIILNRYIYLKHHQALGGRRARWRCIDYRKMHCPAFVDTEGDIVISRKFIHCHPYHDNKILKKVQRNLVFSNTAKALNTQKTVLNDEGETPEEYMDESD